MLKYHTPILQTDVFPRRGGRLLVTCGPMFAGKTTRLQQTFRMLQQAKQPVTLMTHASDTRFSEEASIITHDRVALEDNVFSLKQLSAWSKHVDNPAPRHIIIDEVQFFEDAVDAIRGMMEAGHTVHAFGLDMDFRGRGFGVMGELLAMADTVAKCTSLCECGALATHTKRMNSNVKQVVAVGASESYAPCCFACFMAHRKSLAADAPK